MSKRLNKRQQREQEELAELETSARKAGAEPAVADEDDVESTGAADDNAEAEATEPTAKPANLFAALNLGEDDDAGADEDEAEDDAAEVTGTGGVATSKSKKKKKKKKKAATTVEAGEGEAVEQPAQADKPSVRKNKKKSAKDEVEEDELDRALREVANKYGEAPPAASSTQILPASGSQAGKLRAVLAVDSKMLDPEVELKRFFGSKVIASATSANSTPQNRNQAAWTRHQAARIAKLRTTFVKPKVTWSLQGGAHGLHMREMTDDEVRAGDARHAQSGAAAEKGKARENERWYTFEHDAAYRQVQMQFLGAVRSHDPNQLQALLSVYSWHVDTLLQMSEVFRQQGSIGEASDFCDRALFAFDRCLAPGFSLNGACRLDFDRVENRPLFMVLHRNISHLVRRGLWTTAFGYAKALLSLDPHDDPHGALLWLDFLAVKSSNLDWLAEAADILDVEAFPGMAYARAMAARIQEKKGDHSRSDERLQQAILKFPQVVQILADKAGMDIPGSIRSNPYFALQVGYSDEPSTSIHLMSHLYANRNAPLWKEPENASWFVSQIKALEAAHKIPSGNASTASAMASPRLRSRDNIPMWLCRHAYLAENYMGFLPPSIQSRLGHAFDPLPPPTAITQYDQTYFQGSPDGPRRRGTTPALDGQGSMAGLLNRLAEALGGNENVPEGLMERLRGLMRGQGQGGAPGMMDVQELENFLDAAAQDMGMPGAFPGEEGEEDEDDWDSDE